MALESNPVSIELTDIQGIIIRGYGNLPYSNFVLLQIDDPAIVRSWLHSLLSEVTYASESPEKVALNIAFTCAGIRAIGLAEENVKNFPIDFREGMATQWRQRILGDYGESAPQNWQWGGVDDNWVPVDHPHIILALYGENLEAIDMHSKKHVGFLKESPGFTVLHEQTGYRREDHKENFGFHDSISQPVIKGSGRKDPSGTDTVATGEFILGYLDEHNLYPYSPLITLPQGNMNLLSPDANGSGYKDLGRNGTFLVYRVMQQFVNEFHEFTKEKTRNEAGDPEPEAQIKLEAKMVGRWPSGAPLVKFPDGDPGNTSDDNNFNYAELDPYGYRCPLGSHLRRNNPRDSFRNLKPKQSLRLTRRHRILRRGRLYPIPPGFPENPDPDLSQEVGLHFFGINSNISEQFEFIQHVWANNDQPNKHTLTGDPDPLIGVPDKETPGPKNKRFTIQQEPVAKCIEDLKRFVAIRAGAYFFLPGISGLRFLATLGNGIESPSNS